jgi:hypothetical protein
VLEFIDADTGKKTCFRIESIDAIAESDRDPNCTNILCKPCLTTVQMPYSEVKSLIGQDK